MNKFFFIALISVGNPRFPWIIDLMLPEETPNIEQPEGKEMDIDFPNGDKFLKPKVLP